jgi:uncharacterized membrane protein
MTTNSRFHRFAELAVVYLCAFGFYRVVCAMFTLFDHRPITNEADRLFHYPIWAALHFTAGGLWAVLAPFQLWGRIRSRFIAFHRAAGRIAAVAGVITALSGISLVFAMPERPVSERSVMTSFFLLFLFFLGKAVAAIRARNIAAHREWMVRMIALGLGPMTQRIIFPVFLLSFGIRSTPQFWDLFVTAAWLGGAINLFVCEWWLSRGRAVEIHGAIPVAM